MRNQLVLGAALAAMLAACGGKTDDSIGQTTPAGTGGSSVGGSSSTGKGGGSAGFAGQGVGGSGTAGSGTAGSGTAGAGGGGGTGGSATVGGSSGAGGGKAGSGGGTAGSSSVGGAGGSTSCCTNDNECGDFAYTPCVNGVCKPTIDVPPGQCWADGMCPGGTCQGAIVCPCGTQCKQGDKPGVCVYPTSDWQTCAKPGDCLLEAKTCCDACGIVQVGDVDAVDFAKTGDHFKDVCPNPTPCPACVSQQNPDVAAFCVANKCNVVEISKDDVSACNVDTDCEMHLDQCCDCGTAPANQYVALHIGQIGAYEAQICGPGVGGCTADCVAMHPPGYAATCNQATKHCEVTPLNGSNSCPATPPSGGSCNLPNGTMCEYGQDVIAACREHIYCQNGQWSFPPGVPCPPIDVAGNNGCLSTVAESGTMCPTQGQNCDMGGGTVCTCGSCFGGPCMMNPTWSCSGDPGPGCPTIAPDAGQPCGEPGLSCSYGVPCSFSMAMRSCDGGIWTDHPIACANLGDSCERLSSWSVFSVLCSRRAGDAPTG